jgi:hypothetical protein
MQLYLFTAYEKHLVHKKKKKKKQPQTTEYWRVGNKADILSRGNTRELKTRE